MLWFWEFEYAELVGELEKVEDEGLSRHLRGLVA